MKKVTLSLLLLSLGLVGCTTAENQRIDHIESSSQSNEIDLLDTTDTQGQDTSIKDSEYLILANKENYLKKDYVPSNLTKLDIPFTGAESSNRLKDEAAKAMEDMFAAAKADGITLKGRSGYRSYQTQVQTYNSKVEKLGQKEADKFSAKPGASEHQTGLAMDIISSEFDKLHTDFQYTKTYKWLVSNCSQYGFILRYPKGKSSITGYNYEPWHYRYVGVEHSQVIMDKGLTLEEYLESLN